jgi:hypothetical protein
VLPTQSRPEDKFSIVTSGLSQRACCIRTRASCRGQSKIGTLSLPSPQGGGTLFLLAAVPLVSESGSSPPLCSEVAPTTSYGDPGQDPRIASLIT